MNAKLVEQRGRFPGWREYDAKECIEQLKLVAVTEYGLRCLITLRFYMGKSPSASVVYAVLELHELGPKVPEQRTASGRAGGGGYHKKSAAASEAFVNAGVLLSKGIDSVGDGAIREAMRAVAIDIYGVDTFLIV